jgi:sugar phosphate isomerase/epimerase
MLIPFEQLGVSVNMSDAPEKCLLLADSGVRSIETSYRNIIGKTPSELEEFSSLLDNHGIRLWSVHAPYGKGNELSDLCQANRFRTVATAKSLIPLVSKLGASVLVLHPSTYTSAADEAAAEENLLLSIEELLPIAEEYGIILGLENLLPGCIATDPQILASYIEDFNSPWLKITFDVGHASCCGTLRETFETLAPHIAHFHVHDNDGKNDLHLPPGKGCTDWKTFGQIYSSMDFQNPVIVECETWGKESYKEMLDKFNSLIS